MVSTNLNLQSLSLIKPGLPVFALNGLSGYVFIDKAALFSSLASRIPAPALLKPASHSENAASDKRCMFSVVLKRVCFAFSVQTQLRSFKIVN